MDTFWKLSSYLITHFLYELGTLLNPVGYFLPRLYSEE